MVEAYILIQTDLGAAPAVAAAAAQLPGVTAADDVTGPYDVIVRAAAQDVDELGRMVVSAIQGIEGITRTLTCPVVRL
ncbi:Lrp/AsnC family transcriptional regulator [Nitriliruptoraceae bacterium ZYF776]|nr:Lrp/AsnC family transcriptional regulator [Profundirhabdus halotolerans]